MCVCVCVCVCACVCVYKCMHVCRMRRYLPMTLALNGVPYRSEDTVNTSTDDLEQVQGKIRRVKSLFRSANAKPYRLMTKTLGEEEFEKLAARMVVTTPAYAQALGNVLRYFHSLKNYPDLFSMKAFSPTMLYDKSNTKKFLDLLMQHCNVATTPPGSKQTDPLLSRPNASPAGGSSTPGTPRAGDSSTGKPVIVSSARALHLQEISKRYGSMKPVEKCATWMAADWDGVSPDFNAFRDMHFLFRLALEPARAFRVCNPSLPRLWCVRAYVRACDFVNLVHVLAWLIPLAAAVTV